MVNDPIGDYINRIKNAGRVKLPTLDIPYSKMKESISSVLKHAGFIAFYNIKGKTKKMLEIGLVYKKDGSHRISGAKRISKPGRRVYQNHKEIKPIKFGKGLSVFSTPAGVLSGKEARKKQVGGEVLFEIW